MHALIGLANDYPKASLSIHCNQKKIATVLPTFASISESLGFQVLCAARFQSNQVFRWTESPQQV